MKRKELNQYFEWLKTNENQPRPVGQKQANAWGLHDMLGNVWEWCQDWYDKNYYQSSPGVDPEGPPSRRFKTLRGGSWLQASGPRSAARDWFEPDVASWVGGFRCARELIR